ncbi:MAG TPA: biotin transporter BioY [Longimicrobiales bacterium]
MSEMMLQVRNLAGAEVIASRTARRVLAVAVFTVLTALGAYVTVPVPGTAVPITLQGMVVILAGALLGGGLGVASQVTYLVVGALGLPVFSGGAAGLGWLFGPTGGFLLAFPPAAAVTAAVAGPRGSGPARLALAFALGSALILAGGWAQLAILTGDPGGALRLGVLPFLPGDALKIVGAVLVAIRLRSRTLGRV